VEHKSKRNVEKYKNWSDTDYTDSLESKQPPCKVLAILRPKANFWDVLYMSPDIINPRDSEN